MSSSMSLSASLNNSTISARSSLDGVFILCLIDLLLVVSCHIYLLSTI